MRRSSSRLLTVAALGAALLATANGAGAAKPKIKAPPKLKAAVSAKGTVSLRTAKGAAVKQLKPGWYTLTIADDSHALNFHIVGPGVNHATGVKFRGVEIWGMHVRKGLYHFRSDPRAHMTRSFRVS